MALKSFSVQLQEFIEKTKVSGDLVVRGTLFRLDDKLVDRSPVGDADRWKHPAPPGYSGGRFKGAWMVSADSPATGETGRIDKDGDATKEANKGVIAQAKAGGLHYIVNNVPYAQRIEEGWSSIAPIGVVAVTVVEFRTMVDNAVNEVRQGTSAADFAQGWSTYKL